jgi:hypothetical protein
VTYLQSHCLGVTPLTKESVQAICNNRFEPLDIQQVKNLCMSHERLRAEAAGAEIVWREAQAVVDRLKEQIRNTEELYRITGDMPTRIRLFNEINILKRILGDYK